MVCHILSHNNVEIASRYTSDSGKITFSFSCPADVSELILEQLENIGLDTWFGSVYVTSCDLYKSGKQSNLSQQLSDSVANRLILVQEMVWDRRSLRSRSISSTTALPATSTISFCWRPPE